MDALHPQRPAAKAPSALQFSIVSAVTRNAGSANPLKSSSGSNAFGAFAFAAAGNGSSKPAAPAAAVPAAGSTAVAQREQQPGQRTQASFADDPGSPFEPLAKRRRRAVVMEDDDEENDGSVEAQADAAAAAPRPPSPQPQAARAAAPRLGSLQGAPAFRSIAAQHGGAPMSTADAVRMADRLGRSAAQQQRGAAAAPQQQAAAEAQQPEVVEIMSESDGEEDEAAAARAREDAAEQLLQEVERISRSLRAAVGGLTQAQGPGGAGSGGGASTSRPLVTAAQLAEVVGPEPASRLKPYQVVGINYLLQLAAQHVGGVILADEMGLGKTAQTCMYLAALRSQLGDEGPHLVVVPASLLENWQRELQAWAPNLKVLVYYGPQRERLRHRLKRQWDRVRAGRSPGPDSDDDVEEEEDEHDGSASGEGEEEEEDEEQQQDGDDDVVIVNGAGRSRSTGGGCGGLFDVMLTTYTVWEREGATYSIDRAFLSKWAWSHVVMDEAHALKNSLSTRTRKLCRVAQGAAHRVMLTGTPLQNDLQELHSLLSFLLPAIFRNSRGAEALAEQVAAAAGVAVADSLAQQGGLVERMKRLLQPFILRRMKSEVADQLVAKQHDVVLLDMAPEQHALYGQTVRGMQEDMQQRVAAKGSKPRGRPPKKGAQQQGDGDAGPAAAPPSSKELVTSLGSNRVQHMFTQLRKVAQHPLLVRSRYTPEQVEAIAQVCWRRGLFGGSPVLERCRQELAGYSDHQLHNFAASHPKLLSQYILPRDAVLCSAKTVHLDELLPRLKAAGSRVLLFSQWTTVLDLLEWYMELRGHAFCRLDGSTQVEERLALCDAFNAPASPFFVFLLSTRAGGQGLNLTGADTVILHDVDFNPQIDRQAEDRAHRLGQTRAVTVYRLVTRGTVDSNIQAIAERKLALDAAVLGDMTVTVGGPAGPVGANGKASGKGAPAETQHMAEILSSLLAAPPAAAAAVGGEGGQGVEAAASGAQE